MSGFLLLCRNEIFSRLSSARYTCVPRSRILLLPLCIYCEQIRVATLTYFFLRWEKLRLFFLFFSPYLDLTSTSFSSTWLCVCVTFLLSMLTCLSGVVLVCCFGICALTDFFDRNSQPYDLWHTNQSLSIVNLKCVLCT